MKSKMLSAAVAACGLLLAVPASAQGVKIGILNDQSGVYADYGGKHSLEAAKMAIEDFGGSVLGQPIELVTADHQNKPDLGASKFREFADTKSLTVLLGGSNTGVSLAMAPVAKERKIPFFAIGAGG